MKKLLLTTIFIALFSICAYSQERNELEIANARLVKVLDSLDKAEQFISALKTENEAISKLNSINGQIIEAQKTQIEAAKAEILILKAKSQRKISLFFGILKIRY